MRITQSQLRQIIKEELNVALDERKKKRKKKKRRKAAKKKDDRCTRIAKRK